MNSRHEPESPVTQIGRYTLLGDLASGGMGTVHLAKFHGEAGFSRLLAVKRLHPQFAKDPDFICMFLDEARIASRIRHPHVVSVVDVVAHKGELLLAMDYVQGLPLSKVLRLVQPAPVPLRIASAIAGGLLQGLHAAHEAKDDKGEHLELVHRDVSPQNVMLGEDGAARVVDFGIASAAARLQTTAQGQVKGKLGYMSPEQVNSEPLDRRTDIFAAGVVLWEMITGQRFCEGDVGQKVGFLTRGDYPSPATIQKDVPRALDRVVMRALDRDPARRFPTAAEMMEALYAAASPAHDHEVAAWLREQAGLLLDGLAQQADAAEALTMTLVPRDRSSSAPDEPLTQIAIEPAQKNRKGWWSAALVLVLLFGAAALWFLPGEGPEVRPEATAPLQEVNAAASLGKGEVQKEETSSETAPKQEESAPVIDAPLAEEPDPPEPPPAPVRPRPVAKPRIKKDPCSPPYVLLKGGLKRYKPECL